MYTQPKVDWWKFLLSVLVISLLLYFGRNLFVPLSFALLISFILFPICRWLENIRFPRWAAIGLCLLIVLGVVGVLVWVLVAQMIRFADEWPSLQAKLAETLSKFSDHLEHEYHIDTLRQKEWLEGIATEVATSAFNLAQGLIYTSAVGVVFLVLIPLYAALILYYREQLTAALYTLFPRSEHRNIKMILHETIITYYNFIKGMVVVYVVVGALNSVGLLLLGIPHAVFFGVIASILTFIPYLGIIIGAILPITVAWITYDSIWYPIGVVIVFSVVQYLEANLIFPWAVSFRLQVNMLFTLLAIVAGGILWGASGMILFIPFLAILKLIADKHKNMRAISILLSPGETKEEEKG